MAFGDTLQAPLQAGSTDYQKKIVQNTAASTEPYYQQALRQARQQYANRGVLDSGYSQQGQGEIGQQYLQALTQAGNQAAIGGADLAEQNRQREEQRGWQVQDRDLANRRQDDYMNRAEGEANAKKWSDLISGGASAAGTVIGSVYGGPVGGAVGGQAGGALGKTLTKPKPTSGGGTWI